MGEMKEKRPLYTYRAAITKEEPIRYISHLDYAELIQRTIRRTKLPAAYSEGFNPHMKLAFASALAVGVTSEAEYMDFELTAPVPAVEVAARLREQLPAGVQLCALRPLEGRHKALMAEVDQADYKIILSACWDESAARKAVQSFNEAAACWYRRYSPKKCRDIEVKQYVAGEVKIFWDKDAAWLTFSLRITPSGSIKPGEVLSVLSEQFSLPGNKEMALIHRTALWHERKSLMDSMGS